MEAVTWFSRAHEAGHNDAARGAAAVFQFLSKNVDEERYGPDCVKWLTKAADRGNQSCMMYLAQLHDRGDLGLEHNAEEAFKWYLTAAQAGCTEAYCPVGYCYSNADGVKGDPSQAIYWYEKSANAGDEAGMINLANFYVRINEFKTAMQWYKRAFEAGEVRGAVLYAETERKQNVFNSFASGGELELPSSSKTAVDMLVKAAKAGETEAMFFLGTLYEGGKGVKKDTETAVELYRAAASRGHADAKSKLSKLGLKITFGAGGVVSAAHVLNAC